jgi:flagellar export protein FliJ
MMRYRFRLAQVLRVRSIERDRAVGEVARARTDLAAAELRTVDAVRRYEVLAPAYGTNVAELRAEIQTRHLLFDAIAIARLLEQEKGHVLAERLDEWTEADKKVRLLEELDVRSRARHQALVLTTEQQELDDLVTSRRAGALQHASDAS